MNPLRIAMIAGLNEWAAKYPSAAELLFDSPEEYVERVENAIADLNSKYANEMSDEEYVEREYWDRADVARHRIATEITARFQLKAAE
jgi:hypothetical protein